MGLLDKQFRFTEAVGELIAFAYNMGYKFTLGDGHRNPKVFGEFGTREGYGSAKSLHKLRLAIDFNLFVDRKYITQECIEYTILHEYWKTLGGAEAISGDPNHFSFEHNGMR